MINPSSPSTDNNLINRKIVVCVTGGIAAYKTATLVSRLAQSGAQVRVAMTESATHFITPLTLQSLSGQPVITEIWQTIDRPDAQHIGTARWADLVIIAPASMDMMAKIAAGICDDPVSLIVSALPRTTPVLLAPAMNEQMWQNPITQRNLTTLKDLLGYQIIGPGSGWQACRTFGEGRMSDPQEIFEQIVLCLK